MCQSRNNNKYNDAMDQNKSFENVLFHNQF